MCWVMARWRDGVRARWPVAGGRRSSTLAPVPRVLRTVLIRAALLGGTISSGAFAQVPAGVLELRIEAPAELAATAGELERLDPGALEPALRLTGTRPPQAPILVVLAAEDSELARWQPSWIGGYADGARGVVVLIPARRDRYPDRGLVPLLRHEVTHVLVARAAGGYPVPRWFNEGLALAAGREWELGDRARVALAVLTGDRLPLARLDASFAGGEREVQEAYALAGDVVRELLSRFGADALAAILAHLAQGERFEDAFRLTTGVELAAFEGDYWRDRTFWDRWMPVISSSVVLWGGIALLAIAAFRRRATRDAERLREWGEEEAQRGGEVEGSDS